MKAIQVGQARAEFSALIRAAQRGEPTIITRYGRPAAVLLPVKDALELYPAGQVGFFEHLLAFPGGIDFERNETPLRDVDL